MGEDEIYGSALSKAYELESQIAEYPRIVVGDDLFEYLTRIQNETGNSRVQQYSSEIATNCLQLLTTDADGRMIVDHMGIGHCNQIESNTRRGFADEVIPMAYRFVSGAQRDFQIKQNSKLAFRYTLLKRYMDERLLHWQLNMSNPEDVSVNDEAVD